MTTLQTKEAQVFTKYLEDRKVVIADASASSRSGLFKVFHDLGAKTSNLTLANTFEAAQTAISQMQPHVVIAEYDLGKRCGLELLQSQRQQRPQESKDCLFVVVTGNTSQTAVAKAAEEDIDAYILKPFTPDSVRKTIMQAAIRKIRPPEYDIAIAAGKKLLVEAKLDEAEKEFTRATSLDPSPSLAFYYLGQVKFMRQILGESKGSYEKGLSYNRIHYKCMIGLYELLMQQKNHSEAYEVVKKVSQYFPANPKRLTEVLRLAVMTGEYEDIEKYYSTFTNIDDRNDMLIKYVCAALVVCGKYYLSANLGKSRALELFRKAAVTGTGRVNILKEIILALIENGMVKDTYPFLERFPLDSHESDDYLLLRFLIANAENNVSGVINQGRALMARGLADERLYTILIRRGVEAKLTPIAIEEIMSRAAAKLPGKRSFFEGLLKECQTAPA